MQGIGNSLPLSLLNHPPYKIALVTNAFIPPDSKLCGAGGHEVWTFKAIGEGQVEISMNYTRPWEKDQPVRTNVFTVIVK